MGQPRAQVRRSHGLRAVPGHDYFFDLKSARTIGRALALPPGEYDVYAALIDRARAKTSRPMILRRTLTIPDFWSDQLTLSSLILARDVRALKAALAGERQAEHPYTFGQLEVVPLSVASFSTGDALSVVFQMCNYGAPDSDVTAEYAFYRVDGGRRLFNRTERRGVHRCVWGKIAVRLGRGVAQPGRALGSGPRGRRFKSSRPDQIQRLKRGQIS